MKARSRENGYIGAIVLAIVALVLVAFAASYVFSRLGTRGDERTQSSARLARAADMIEQFATTAERLPCPADPSADTGLEVRAGNACAHGEGTLPWLSIGARREESFDAWGRKISYRVYTGAAGSGSLTQDYGISMVYCDLVDPAPTAGANGICERQADIYYRSTSTAQFLGGKGLSLTDMGNVYGDVAYLVMSHGVTGLGSYTASGARREMPTGIERNNTRSTGPFTIQAFSDPDTSASAGTFFDDLIVYRRLEPLVKRINLYARDWPDMTTSSQVFNQANVQAAYGSAVTSGQNIGQTLDFGALRVSAFTGGEGSTTATDITYINTSGNAGLGVAGRISSAAGEFLRFDFDDAALTFAVTLEAFNFFDFGGFGTYDEQVEFRFYLGEAQVGSAILKTGCSSQAIASFRDLAPGGPFNRVEVQAKTANGTVFFANAASEFSVAEVKACSFLEASCTTSLSAPANNCS